MECLLLLFKKRAKRASLNVATAEGGRGRQLAPEVDLGVTLRGGRGPFRAAPRRGSVDRGRRRSAAPRTPCRWWWRRPCLRRPTIGPVAIALPADRPREAVGAEWFHPGAARHSPHPAGRATSSVRGPAAQ